MKPSASSKNHLSTPPKIASREARYRAVMKYHQRILETGSARGNSEPTPVAGPISQVPIEKLSRAHLTSAPPGCSLLAESGREIRVGDEIRPEDGQWLRLMVPAAPPLVVTIAKE